MMHLWLVPKSRMVLNEPALDHYGSRQVQNQMSCLIRDVKIPLPAQ